MTESGQFQCLFLVDFLHYSAAQRFVLIPSVDTLYAVMTEPMRAILQYLYQKEFVKILNCFKSVLENKNFCILLHKMILHMQKWGGSPLYPIFELQRI